MGIWNLVKSGGLGPRTPPPTPPPEGEGCRACVQLPPPLGERAGVGAPPLRIWPCPYSARRLKDEGGQRRKREQERVRPPVPAHRFGFDRTAVAEAAAAIFGGIGVEPLAPSPAARHPDAVFQARHRREVAHD